MKKFWFTTSLLLLTTVVFCQKDAETGLLLKAAADKALAYSTIQTQFEFTVENSQEKTEDTYLGELYIKGHKFKMVVDKTVTFCDGKNRWVYLPDVNEVNISKVEKAEGLDPEERFLIEPLSLFTIYENGFKYNTLGTQEIDGKNYTVVDLSPEDISKPYFKIKCWISETNDYYAVKYFQKDGTRIALQLIDFKANEKLKDDLFVFRAVDYPNVEIIDLRE